MSQVIRGWHERNGRMQPQTAVRWPQSHQHNVGFRLVHDADVKQPRLEGCRYVDPQLARAAVRIGDDPGCRYYGLGLRLVWDRS